MNWLHESIKAINGAEAVLLVISKQGETEDVSLKKTDSASEALKLLSTSIQDSGSRIITAAKLRQLKSRRIINILGLLRRGSMKQHL